MSSSHSPRRPEGMDKDEFLEAVSQRIALIVWAAVKAELSAITTTCMNCDHWLEGSQICGKYNMLPPPHVIANGCPAYEYKGPPF